MRKRLLLWVIVLLCFSAVSTAGSVQLQDVTLSITEFGYPYIPNAAQVDVHIPIFVEGSSGKRVEFAVDAWYRATSPYLCPVPFFEIGVVPSITLFNVWNTKLAVGVGTAYSQGSEGISMPAIFPVTLQFTPFKAFSLALMLQSMIYDGGMLAEITATAGFGPFFDHLLVKVGGAANIVYEWEQNLEHYSYGLLFGIGYRL